VLPPIALIFNWRATACWASQSKGVRNLVLVAEAFPNLRDRAEFLGVGRG